MRKMFSSGRPLDANTVFQKREKTFAHSVLSWVLHPFLSNFFPATLQFSTASFSSGAFTCRELTDPGALDCVRRGYIWRHKVCMFCTREKSVRCRAATKASDHFSCTRPLLVFFPGALMLHLSSRRWHRNNDVPLVDKKNKLCLPNFPSQPVLLLCCRWTRTAKSQRWRGRRRNPIILRVTQKTLFPNYSVLGRGKRWIDYLQAYWLEASFVLGARDAQG